MLRGIILNTYILKYQKFNKFTGTKNGHQFNLQIYAWLKEGGYKLIKSGSFIRVEKGLKKVYHTDKWTSIFHINRDEYNHLKDINGAVVRPSYLKSLGNCYYEFQLIKELAKNNLIWRSKESSMDFSIIGEKPIHIEITSTFYNNSYIARKSIIERLWRTISKQAEEQTSIIILNKEWKTSSIVCTAKKLNMNIIFAEFTPNQPISRRIVNLDEVVRDLNQYLFINQLHP